MEDNVAAVPLGGKQNFGSDKKFMNVGNLFHLFIC